MLIALWVIVPVALFLGFLLNVALMGPRTKNLKFPSRDAGRTPSRGRIAPLINVVSVGEPRSGPYGP